MSLLATDLILPPIINPNEKINRILKTIGVKQNGHCLSCRDRITRDHSVVSRGRPRHYYPNITPSNTILSSSLAIEFL